MILWGKHDNDHRHSFLSALKRLRIKLSFWFHKHHLLIFSALDLDYRDLRNLDPNLASSLLEEIKLGADLGPILEKIRASSLPKRASNPTKETKSVTFEDEAK